MREGTSILLLVILLVIVLACLFHFTGGFQ